MTVPELNVETQGLSRLSASKFAEKWKDVKEEEQYDQSFWSDFFRNILGIEDLQSAGIQFQKKVLSSKKGTWTKMDVFWKDTFIVEHKSAGKDLDAAVVQAREYLVSLPPALRPPVIIVCDFARMRIVDVLLNTAHEFRLEDLPDNLHRIEAVINHKSTEATQVQVEADQKAAQLMADLYVQLEKYGYEGHEASVFMVRILFCLFADDTRMWKTNIFYDLVNDTNSSGVDVGPRLSNLFVTLDTPKEQRRGPQDPFMAEFPYVNGGIFSERLETINFNADMRKALVNACNYDWSSINPTIFGALFQDIKSKDERRANGEHYTTEANIDKTIKPLFLDELHNRLERDWDNSSKLKALQRELGTYRIFDPACGCGNFLITSYKRLRQLELDIIVRIKQLDGTSGETSLFDVSQDIYVRLEQLHGIEYVEWSAQIAQVAIYLTDHQENIKLETVLGTTTNRFPLSHAAKIIRGNALQIDWREVCPSGDSVILIGNPPFLGASYQNVEQKTDQAQIWGKVRRSGALDYVSNWYLLAAKLIHNTKAKAAFVSTNSISQGEQPAVIWGELYQLGMDINFAHRTFIWQSDASGKAAVHCVIVGFSDQSQTKSERKLFVYPTGKGAGIEENVSQINAYLLDAPKVLITSRTKPLSPNTPIMSKGSQPTDDGHLSSISAQEADEIRTSDPIAAKYLRPLIGAQEFIQGKERFCLWLLGADINDLAQSQTLRKKISLVKEMRLNSTKAATRKDADKPSLFQEIRQPETNFLAVPEVSGENRDYIPVGFFGPEFVPTNKIQVVPGGDKQHFSILTSSVFSAWVKGISGRLGNSFSISSEITYNNFPFPELSNAEIQTLQDSGDEVLAVRATYKDVPLSTLNDPLLTPPDLLAAYRKNDAKVMKIFGLDTKSSELEVLSKLLLDYKVLAERVKG